MRQTCVFENQAKYQKANRILTSIIKEANSKLHISKGLYKAISQFQLQVKEKQPYLAYWVRKFITMSFDPMTTSSVESINCYIKHKSKVSDISF
jgi:hypothetical protein